MSELLEKILDKRNMNESYKKVCASKGAGGVDGMEIEELDGYIRENWDSIREQIRERSYNPQPVRRVEIPKPNGSKRKLGIPTMYEWIVDIDLEKFFDSVPQDKLMSLVHNIINDGDTESLIRKYLKAGVMVQGRYEKTDRGTPQGGGPLSPLCGNVMLNELDKELERRGHRFVRYADDALIFCKSRKSARRTLANIIPFIEGELFLKVNRAKTTVTHVSKIKYLGYAFYRNKGWSNDYRRQKLAEYVRGWINYYKLADMKGLMTETDEWLRRRIRAI